jgi:hypothetical protein
MSRKGQHAPGMAAKLIFVFVGIATIFVAWAVLLSFDGAPLTTSRGSQSLPEQAAQGNET